MKRDVYCLIRANDTLRSVLGWEGVDLGGFEDEVLGPMLWATHESDRSASGAHHSDDEVKRIFLRKMSTTTLRECGADRLAESIVSGETEFDDWWVLERFAGVDAFVSEVELALCD